MKLCSPTIICYILAALLLAWFPTRAARAQTAESDVRALLQSRDAEIKRLAGSADSEVTPQARERLRSVINDVIDFESMSRAALGTHWSGLTAAQQSEFVTVFGAIIRGQSLSSLGPYRARVSYESLNVEGGAAHVVTSTVYKDVPMTIAYDLAWNGDVWRATDIILDDVSTVEGYARSFQTLVRKRGFDTLMERLRAKRQEVEQGG